jgi:NAD(P)-dependent dehydrogenase (short-subunit alcohol dehydrogenase family)
LEVRVDGKILLVTGATQGVGRAVAFEAAKSGVGGVMLTGRDKNRGAAAAAQLKVLGVRADFIAAELEDPLAPTRVISATLEAFGRIDLLVNAAALSDRGSIVDSERDLFDRLFAVNTRAPMFLMQGFVRHLKQRAAPGSIVNILSVNAHGGSPGLAVYAATKAATALLTKNAAYAHRYDRIRVNGINLGWTDTPGEREMQAVKLGYGEAWLAQAEARMPWGRLISPGDVGKLALFLLSDASIPMTGSLVDQEQDFVLGVRD